MSYVKGCWSITSVHIKVHLGQTMVGLFFIVFLFLNQYSHASPHKLVINVDHYGAKGDGISDDRMAFLKSWRKACSSHLPAVLLVPEEKNYLLRPPLNFSGPCKSRVSVLIKGTLEAPSNRSYWNNLNRKQWILFHRIRNLVVGGGGMINGNGQEWWQNSCKTNTSLPCSVAPTALNFTNCNDLKIENLRIKDSQQIHLTVSSSNNVKASKLFIIAPEDSPNTDGIHVSHTRNMVISNCDIGTGDDCISIVSGSRFIEARNIVCGPGHGISIGSLGANHSKAHVRNVIVDTATLIGTHNGLRIKSWQGGRGYAKHISFQNIMMHHVKNPILVNQSYCDSKIPCHEQHDAVKISHVLYKNIMGTSNSTVSVKLQCSKSVPCHGIVLQDINLVGKTGKQTQSLCENVRVARSGITRPTLCV